ncbi:MAG: extracellular solute-binding protein, partial [Chloroflexota bacterium]
MTYSTRHRNRVYLITGIRCVNQGVGGSRSMAQEIELSIMASTPEGIQPLLDKFEAEHRIHVRLRLMAWDTAWSALVKSALYNDGPDVSEIGTTWIGDLAGMNALRPLDTNEVAAMGKSTAFFQSAWATATQLGDWRVWSIPWLTGSRLIYYRPHLLEKAGIDPHTAFRSNEQIHHTISRLHASGVKIPWTVPTGETHTTLLNAASWVWAAGGDFIADNGKSVRFMEPAALAGLKAYFMLGRYLAPGYRNLKGLEPDELFLSEPETAATASGPWLFLRARERLGDEAASKISVALPPGASFVGGSNLAIWKYSRYPDAAVKLIRFLTQTPAQVYYTQQVGLLPAKVDALSAQPFCDEPLWQLAFEGLKTGRTFPTIRLWGLIEERTSAALGAVWA